MTSTPAEPLLDVASDRTTVVALIARPGDDASLLVELRPAIAELPVTATPTDT